MPTTAQPLQMPLRARVVLKYWGQLTMIVGCLGLVPLAVSYRAGAQQLLVPQALAVALPCALGWVASRLRVQAAAQANEAMAVAALTFVTAPLPLALPFMATGISFVDALFETISGVTTTGLSVLPTVATLPEPLLFQRAFMQWFGGLGIIVLLLALTPHPGRLERSLALAERVEDDLVGGTAAHARRALLTYGALTAGAITLVWLAGASSGDAVLYALAAVSTGGFAPHDTSLTALPGLAAQTAVTVASLAGAVSLVTHRAFVRDGLRKALRDVQLRALLAFGLLASLACTATLTLLDGLSPERAIVAGPMMALSAQSTSGFSYLSASEMGAGTKLLLMASMFTGGSLGSTAGGIKLLRVLILWRILKSAWIRLQLPRHAVYEPRLGEHVLRPEDVQTAGLVVGLSGIVVLLSWGTFIMAGIAPLDALFEVVSATGTVGLTSGVSSPSLPAGLKLVLCLDMLMGRLEVLPLLVLLRMPQLPHFHLRGMHKERDKA